MCEILVQILVSSANIQMFVFIHCDRSLMKSKNKSGPRTDPWGTPLSTAVHDKKLPFIPTIIILPSRKARIQFNKFPPNPMLFNYWISRLCGTVSIV